MSDHDHTDEAGKRPEEGIELDLSGLVDETDTDGLQTLIDDPTPDTPSESEDSASLSEPDLGALVNETVANSPGFILHDDAPHRVEETASTTDETPVSDLPEDSATVNVDEEAEPSQAEDSFADEHEEAEPELFDTESSDQKEDEPVSEEEASPTEPLSWGESDAEPLSDEEETFEPLSEEEAMIEPLDASEESSDSSEEEAGADEKEDYGAGTSWLDEVRGSDESDSPDDDGGEEPPEKSGSKLPLLLALLVVVVGAGAYFYFFSGQPAPKPTPFMPPKHESVPVPSHPAAQQEAQAPTQPEGTSAAPEPQQAAPAVEQEGKLAVITPQTPTSKGTETAQPKPEAAATQKQAEPAEKAAQPVQPAAAMTAGGQYTLQGGVFVFRSSLKKIEAKLKKLGFDPQVRDEKKLLSMTRLRVGVFPSEIAAGKLQQVKKLAPHGTFTVKRGDQVTIYVGSYYFARTAQRAAKRLEAKGLSVQQEHAKVKVPVHVLYFGTFADRAAATAKLAEVKKAGVNAVVKKMASTGAH